MGNEMESTLSAATSSSEASALAAPGVVVAIVVDRPTSTLEGVLAAIVAQDYPKIQVLVLLTGSDADELGLVHEIVQSSFATTEVPQPHVYQLGANPGFGLAANTALRLVEGDSGFFLVMHDDVVLAPDSVRILVEELYRSNAGMVGPKFVEWEETRRLQAVGFDCDWFGELDSDVEPHELDQEQHDAVRDVFVLPSACFLIRADLFRELGGFEPSIEFFGEDLDLCWRAHLSGARVVVVPAATARHQAIIVERLATRSRDSVTLERQAERHRITTVASLTGARRLPIVLPLLVLLSLFEAIGAVVRGRWQRTIAVLGGLFSLVTSFGSISRRRSRVRLLRRVPDHEVVELQVRGSVRWKRMIRHRRFTPSMNLRSQGNTSRERDTWVMAAWGVLGVFLFLGGRQLWSNGVHSVGDLLPLP
ncbi:MAG: glycosyltransferase, partial [Actinobacteria bacterium]|nr:glycosyltransferase [Actinomycetota bacterium]